MPGAANRKTGFALADGLRDGGRQSPSLTLSATPWHLSYNNDEQRKSSSVGLCVLVANCAAGDWSQ